MLRTRMLPVENIEQLQVSEYRGKIRNSKANSYPLPVTGCGAFASQAQTNLRQPVIADRIT